MNSENEKVLIADEENLDVNPEVARATAPQKGTDYMETDTDAVWKQCILLVQELNDLRNKDKEIKEKDFKRKFSYLHGTYPSIFNMLMSTNESYENMGTRMGRLKQMLDKINSVKRGERTIDQAHTEIGQQYANEFVPPELMKPQ